MPAILYGPDIVGQDDIMIQLRRIIPVIGLLATSLVSTSCMMLHIHNGLGGDTLRTIVLTGTNVTFAVDVWASHHGFSLVGPGNVVIMSPPDMHTFHVDAIGRIHTKGFVTNLGKERIRLSKSTYMTAHPTYDLVQSNLITVAPGMREEFFDGPLWMFGLSVDDSEGKARHLRIELITDTAIDPPISAYILAPWGDP